MITVGVVEVEVRMTVRHFSLTNPRFPAWRELISSFFRDWQETSEVDISVGP